MQTGHTPKESDVLVLPNIHPEEEQQTI